MVLRGTNQRRRRVVLDEVKQQRGTAETDARKSTKKAKKKPTGKKTESANNRAYAFGADRRNQRKTTDLIPKRLISFSLVVLALLMVVGGINLLEANAFRWQELIGAEGVKAFSFSGPGSISSWFSSFLLIITGMASLQIYALRQHRCDDYRGTYRLWMWMALLFLVASVNCVVDFGEVLGNVVAAVTQQPVGDKVWALVTFKMVALTMLVVRGLFEVKESRGAMAMVAIVWVAYSAAAILQIPSVRDSLVVDFDSVYGNVHLIAVSALMLSMFTYARFIYLHAHGLIQAPLVGEEKAKAKAEKKAAKLAAKEAAIAEKKRLAEEKIKEAEERAAEKQAAIELAAEQEAAEKQAKIDEKQARIDEKSAAKQAKLDEKAAAKQARLDEKAAAKQAKLDEKAAAKQARLDEKAAARQAKVDKKSERIAAKEEANSKRKSKSTTPEVQSENRPPVPKPTKTRPPVPKPSSSEEERDVLKMEDEYAHLSKSERRRQRKLDKRARRAA